MPDSTWIYIPEYLLGNGNHYLLGAYTDLNELIRHIEQVDKHTIFWRRDPLGFAYGFYKEQPDFERTGEIWDKDKHGACSWLINAFLTDDWKRLESDYLYED